MKYIQAILLFSVISFSLAAQKEYTGTYGYSQKPVGNTGNDKQATGPEGKLVLLKMEGNKYRFWLDVTIGWPSYNRGETDGTIHIVNDTASFDNTFEDAENPCILRFRISGNTVQIKSGSSSFNCGFGNQVHADGEYPKWKVQPKLDNAWLRTEYPEAPQFTVNAGSAELFQDENCMVPFSPKKHLSKSERYLNIAETQKSVYTENISPNGVFTWGWLRKSEVKNSLRN